ncbi:MAG: hypothetical protein EBS89_11505, partial [Proteobacteria bacterium]|nr:hypothetical protein [Pseudomonadota bacterium]
MSTTLVVTVTVYVAPGVQGVDGVADITVPAVFHANLNDVGTAHPSGAHSTRSAPCADASATARPKPTTSAAADGASVAFGAGYGGGRTASGAPVAAGATVWAAGPWLPELFPRLVGADAEASIIPVRRDAIYFDAPNMGVGEIPTWIDEGLAVWGIPNDQGHGVKVGPEFDAGSFDPSVWPDEAHPTSIARAR